MKERGTFLLSFSFYHFFHSFFNGLETFICMIVKERREKENPYNQLFYLNDGSGSAHLNANKAIVHTYIHTYIQIPIPIPILFFVCIFTYSM
jgi:hypothetical protein